MVNIHMSFLFFKSPDNNLFLYPRMFFHKLHIVILHLYFTVPEEKYHVKKSAQAPHTHWEQLLWAQQHRQPSTTVLLQNILSALPSDFKQQGCTCKSSMTSLEVVQS